ncbi:hypothetical protein G6O67_007959 [Ophiocordyceps sinensis]|uniref:Uncharacterized protein n=2 Tax=Ophiocordyceps sinensis TaxID=72228 RepID=A0A8H4LRT5_9HYPO|nr:hypothetical protein OCS_01332 [Ophiocordyceps sinensis CO18]KAF4504513.1 hypothetical protein G6O67_007959 [Ophiocordyceps sinensis]
MSTPTTFSIPPPDARDVAARLHDELRRRQEATPEAVFGDKTPEQSYKWLCQLEHRHLKPGQVDDFRASIHHVDYWRHEALHLKKALFHALWQQLCDEHAPDGLHRASDWRSMTAALERRLKRHGLGQCRLSIDHQPYWKFEAEVLGHVSAARDHELYEQLRTRSPPERRSPNKRQTRAMAEPRRSKRLASKVGKRVADKVVVPRRRP